VDRDTQNLEIQKTVFEVKAWIFLKSDLYQIRKIKKAF